MKKWFLILFVAMVLVPVAKVHADDIDIYRYDATDVEPNVLILFDTSGSMLTVLPASGFDPSIDYSTPLLLQGKQIVFAREANGCYPSHHRVTYQTSDGKVLLKYIKATSTTELCSGSGWLTQWGGVNGYFYFDRASGDFIDDVTFDPGNPDHIKIFLPYATYSVDVAETGNYVTRYEYNYMNWLFYHSTQTDRDELKAQFDDPAKRALLTRVLSAKKVIHDLIDEHHPIRFGLMTFDGDVGGTITRNIPSADAAVHADIDNLWVGGSTPLAEALEDAWDFFGDSASLPVDAYCRENFVIIMTDGLPQMDADNLSAYLKKDFDGDHGGTAANGWAGNEENLYAGQGSGYLDDVAYYMARNDARPLEDGFQNVATHTIGFTVQNSLLEDTAANGVGLYETAFNVSELNEAFHAVVGGILAVSTSYSAPVVPISQMEKTTAGNHIYLALFKPTENAFWKGNIKKLGIADTNDSSLGIKKGDILDSNGIRAADGVGEILETSVSYWNTTEDGGETDRGGVGEILLNRSTERQIYSILCGDYTHHRPFTHEHNSFLKSNTRITPQLLGVANETERNKVMDFVHGLDAYDEDGDSDTTEKREWILGAFLHSRPAVIHYNSTTSVIFAGANDGMLHAFLDSDGSELWGFIPPEFLGRLKDLNNINTNTPEYFVDGAASSVIIDSNQDGEISKADNDQAIIIFGERRGGNAYWALDVTDPLDPAVLWTLDNTYPDFLELGQTWSTPTVDRLDNGMVVAVFGGGYDPNRDSDLTPDLVGRGIYMIDVITGNLIWKHTVDEDASMDSSIPSDVTAVDTNDNGYVDRLYVGSLSGKMWRFDLPGPDPVNWTAKIMYDGQRKIFYRPDILLEREYEILVWGTGDRANPKRKDIINRIYMLKDRNVSGLTESDLVDVTDSEDTLTVANGWYINLNTNLGEKVLAPPVTFLGSSYLTTFTPGQGDETDPCYLSEGTARLYVFDYKTGNPVIDMDDDPQTKPVRAKIIGTSIPSGIVITLIEGMGIGFVGVSGGIYNQELSNNQGLIRIYWRQMF